MTRDEVMQMRAVRQQDGSRWVEVDADRLLALVSERDELLAALDLLVRRSPDLELLVEQHEPANTTALNRSLTEALGLAEVAIARVRGDK